MNEPRDMTGVIFRNDKRENDKQPNAKGHVYINSTKYWVAAWTNRPKSGGDPYQSLKFELADDKYQDHPNYGSMSPSNSDDFQKPAVDEDIPW